MSRDDEQYISKKYEEYGYVLDNLPHGRIGSLRPSFRGEGLVQMIGESYYTLLEAVPRRGSAFQIGDRVYVGKRGRIEIEHIVGRISYEQLTSTAKEELPRIIEMIVSSQEAMFVAFFNESQPITPRMHSMELLPGIGKKLMWQVINQRDISKFKSFEDLRERANIPGPVKIISRRILDELSKEEKYRLFTRPA